MKKTIKIKILFRELDSNKQRAKEVNDKKIETLNEKKKIFPKKLIIIIKIKEEEQKKESGCENREVAIRSNLIWSPERRNFERDV